MTEWWDEGYESAKQKYYKTYELARRKKPRLVYDGVSKWSS
jgi:hypothetical protein